jgi:hypothetical protein
VAALKVEKTLVARLATHRNRVRLKVPRSARNPEPHARVFGKTVGATQSEQSFREIKSIPTSGRAVGQFDKFG